MAEKHPSSPRRVSSLEVGMSDVVRNQNPRDTIAQPGSVSWPKMAYTDYDPVSGLYPAEETNPNTYWIKFVDATFDDSHAGLVTRTVNQRQQLARAVVQNIAADYIPHGTLIQVWPQDKRFWTMYQPSSAGGTLPKIAIRNGTVSSGEIIPAHAICQLSRFATAGEVSATVNTSTDVWTLASPVTWATGDALVYSTKSTSTIGTLSPPVTSPTNGLKSTVFARMLSTTTLTLHTTEADAIANTSIINITSAGSSTKLLAPADGSPLIEVVKPDLNYFVSRAGAFLYVVNGSDDIAIGADGSGTYLQCSYDFPVRVLVDLAEWSDTQPSGTGSYDTTPAIGSPLGPKDGSWKAHRGMQGFTIGGKLETDADGDTTVIAFQKRLAPGNIGEAVMESGFVSPYICLYEDVPKFTPVALRAYQVSEIGSEMDWEAFDGLNLKAYKDAGGSNPLWSNFFAITHGNDAVKSPGSFRGDSRLTVCRADRPFYARYIRGVDGIMPSDGGRWGPMPGSNRMHPGLPGFIGVAGGELATSDSDISYGLFVRDHNTGSYSAQAYSDWQEGGNSYDTPFVVCQAVYDDGPYRRVYDGSSAEFPDYRFAVCLPRIWSGSNQQARDPAVFSGDNLTYCAYQGSHNYWSAVSGCYHGTMWRGADPYLDDKIDTVKIWVGNLANIPRGWREFTGLQDRFPIGVLASTGSAPLVASTGGTKTHVHTASGGAGSSGSSQTMNSISHMPPFYGVYFIERYK